MRNHPRRHTISNWLKTVFGLVVIAVVLAITGLSFGSTSLTPQTGSLLQRPAQITKQPVPLGGTVWRLTAYNDGMQDMSAVLPQKEITTTFDADGRVFGSAGCNSYWADYEIKDNHLDIRPIGTTRMYCETPEGTMKQEGQFLAALTMAATYEVEGDQLVIFKEDGTQALSFIVQAKE